MPWATYFSMTARNRGGSVSMPGHPSQFTEERQARLGAKSVSAAQDECGG